MEKRANSLWTSGWDSTFRLLDLLIVQQRVVQPYYVISHRRQISELDMQTMDKIKRLLFTKVPQTRQLLLPTIYKERNDIKPNELITANYKNSAAKSHLGEQYEYLALFAEEEKAYDLELCIGMCYPGFFSNFITPFD